MGQRLYNDSSDYDVGVVKQGHFGMPKFRVYEIGINLLLTRYPMIRASKIAQDPNATLLLELSSL